MEWFTTIEGLTLLMTVATAIMAAITAWNAIESRKMATIAQQQLNIENRPYVTFGMPTVKKNPSGWDLLIPIVNTGKIPAIHKQTFARFRDKIISLPESQPCVFQNAESHISLLVPYTTEGKGDLSIEMEYWPIGEDRRIFKRRRTMTMDLLAQKNAEIIEDWAT